MTEPEFLAAEYALRLLEGEALLDARRRLASDPDFAAEVAGWEERLAPWLDGIPEEAPSDEAWQQILRRLDEQGGAAVVALKRKLTFWRTGAAAAAVAAAVLLMIQLAPTSRAPEPARPPAEAPRPSPLLVASLATEATGETVAVTFLPDSRALVVAPVRLEPGANRTRELWVIPAGGNPISLGVVDGSGVRRRVLPADLARRLGPDATLAMSDEPAGGSPTGQPTGEVLATGTLVSA